MNITNYVNGINSSIVNQTAEESITPAVVGAGFIDLATITKTAIELKLDLAGYIAYTQVEKDVLSLQSGRNTGDQIFKTINGNSIEGTGDIIISGGSGLVLGETSTTAYRGDRGALAYTHSQITTGNPHGTTKSDLGLGNVDNTSDALKPVSTATTNALTTKLNTSIYDSFISSYIPYSTPEKTKLANITGTNTGDQDLTTLVPKTRTITINGVTQPLSADVNFAVSGGGDSGLALGEASTTAYRGDRGKIAYDHSQLVTGNPHGTVKGDIGLGNVDNTSDALKPVSNATLNALTNKENSGVAQTLINTLKGGDTNSTIASLKSSIDTLGTNKLDKSTYDSFIAGYTPYSSAEKTKLTNITGTNTGDQDLTTLVPKTTTITINGVTHDLSGNIAFNVASTGSTVGTFGSGLKTVGGVTSLGLQLEAPYTNGLLTDTTLLALGNILDSTIDRSSITIQTGGVSIATSSANGLGTSTFFSQSTQGISSANAIISSAIGGSNMILNCGPTFNFVDLTILSANSSDGSMGITYTVGDTSNPSGRKEGMIVLDSVNNKGFEYDADYSANYTERSLVDKAYVDLHAGSGSSVALPTNLYKRESSTTSETEFTYSELVNKQVYDVIRGGFVLEVLYTVPQTLLADQVYFNTSTGSFTYGAPFTTDSELIRILYYTTTSEGEGTYVTTGYVADGYSE